jgi:CRP/FNR family transcriptional regulator
MAKKNLTDAELIMMMAGVPHFAGFSEAILAEILQSGDRFTAAAGKPLFWEGDPCAGLYVLLEGEIHLTKIGPDGQRNIMAVLEPVAMFNEVAVLDGGTNPATAVAFQQSQLWWCRLEKINALMVKFPQIALGLLPIMARHNRWLVEQYEDMCFLPVRARTAKLLLEISENGVDEINRGKYPIEVLSSRVSTSPEVVSRTLSLLAVEGMIEVSRRKVRILDPSGLNRLGDGH